MGKIIVLPLIYQGIKSYINPRTCQPISSSFLASNIKSRITSNLPSQPNSTLYIFHLHLTHCVQPLTHLSLSTNLHSPPTCLSNQHLSPSTHSLIHLIKPPSFYWLSVFGNHHAPTLTTTTCFHHHYLSC